MNFFRLFFVYISETGFSNVKGGITLTEFESLFHENKTAIERFVKFKIPNKQDAEDILQDVFLTIHQKYQSLQNKASFKAWCISIATNKCTDYFRTQAQLLCVPIDSVSERVLTKGGRGISEHSIVRETLEKLGDKDKQILYLYFFKELSQEEISRRLDIPLGTVKSRLHTAKNRFKQLYPYSTRIEQQKGDKHMSKLPNILPEYRITASTDAPFPVVFQELPGWFIKPIPGESVSWGSYDMPKRNLTDTEHLKVTCPIEIHGITGVEIVSCADEHYNVETSGHIHYAQLTDTHCRWLGDLSKDKDGIKHLRTFLDSDDYIDGWVFGEDNCGYPTHLSPAGDITRQGNVISTHQKSYLFDVVGRYLLELNGKTYDTICIMEITNRGEMTEQYIDQTGKSILWRRFNHNTWQNSRYQKLWTELLPDSEQVLIDGEIYVHWYDCIADYIL